MQITYKFRLYPSKEQKENLLQTLELCRQTYNYFLSRLNERDKTLSRLRFQAQLPELKKGKPELNNVYSKVLQMVLYQLYSNLKGLSQLKKNGKKVGRLRYKGKGWYKTFVYNQSGFKILKTGKRLDLLHLSKIDDIPVRMHREIKGNIKQIIIKRYNSGKWFACLCIENNTPTEKQQIEKTVGLDVGVKHFVTDSMGRQIENPKFYQKSLRRIRTEHRKLSKKKKGSKNREKQRVRLVRAYEKIRNQRNDFLHKLSRFYIDNYDLIAVEDLQVNNMTRNHCLSGKILDASWGKFFQFLEYKAESANVQVVKVNPRGTSQEYKFGRLDRDYNASLNILQRGLEKVGMGQTEVTPVETEPLPVRASSVVEAGSSFLTSEASRWE